MGPCLSNEEAQNILNHWKMVLSIDIKMMLLWISPEADNLKEVVSTQALWIE